MLSEKLDAWEQTYRAARKLDQQDVLLEHLELLDFDADPDVMCEGTINLIRASAGFLSIGRERHIDAFLSMQAYNPPPNPAAPYIFTFDLYGKAFARAYVGSGENKMIDLADLFNTPWDEYKVAGYGEFLITRADLKPLMVKEIKSLTKMVKEDLYYDYSKDELDIYFNEGKNRLFLHVHLDENIGDGRKWPAR